MKEICWKPMKAGMNLPGDCIVLYYGDPDPRIARCAIYDGHYIPVSELKELPINEK